MNKDLHEQLDLDEIRRRLERKRRQLRQSLADIRENGMELSENPDNADLAQDYVLRERNRGVYDIEQQELRDVEEALGRLDDGTYGICTNCGQPVDPERLEVLPWASLCIDCQAEQERTA